MFDIVINKAEEQLNNKFPVSEGDYIGEDGLLYCGKCHTNKQAKAIIFGKHPRCMCKCENEIFQAEVEKERKQKFAERVRELRKMCFGGSSLVNCTFDNDDRENQNYTNIMKKYVDNFDLLAKEGKGMLLYGGVGTGKTYYACMVANALIDKGYKVYVTNFSTILNELQATFDKQDYIDEVCSPNLLVIDDLGIERDTPYGKEQVYNVINKRYELGLPMIITTNMSIDEIKSAKDIGSKRVYERILELCHPIEINGVNHRRKNIREDYEKTHRILFEGN